MDSHHKTQTAELGITAPDIIFLENFCAPELHNIYVAQYIYCTICAIYILRNIYIERQLLDSRLQIRFPFLYQFLSVGNPVRLGFRLG